MRKQCLAAILVGLALAVSAASCGGSSATRTPLIVDTDLSSDDVIALAYLAADQRVASILVPAYDGFAVAVVVNR